MEWELRPDSQVLRCPGGEGRACEDKEERGKEERREGEIMDNSGGRGVFLKNWDRDPVGERSRARRLEKEGRKKRQMKKYQKNSYHPLRQQTTQSKNV